MNNTTTTEAAWKNKKPNEILTDLQKTIKEVEQATKQATKLPRFVTFVTSNFIDYTKATPYASGVVEIAESGFIYDKNKIEIVNGVARLKKLDKVNSIKKIKKRLNLDFYTK